MTTTRRDAIIAAAPVEPEGRMPWFRYARVALVVWVAAWVSPVTAAGLPVPSSVVGGGTVVSRGAEADPGFVSEAVPREAGEGKGEEGESPSAAGAAADVADEGLEPGLPIPEGFRELHRIRLVNRHFGAVSVSGDGGATWTRIGRVLRPVDGHAKAIAPGEFTASDWAPVGAVAATAVNAVHVKVDQLAVHAAVFSILPADVAPGGVRLQSYHDEPSSMYLDTRAGEGIFGPRWSPTVGSSFFLEDGISGELRSPIPGEAPRMGDRVVIIVTETLPRLRRVLFDNRFAGAVTAEFEDGRRFLVARVLRPVTGTGRFGGTAFLGPGLLRANHPGVICVSTSPVGEAGGFQIIPSVHASDPDLSYVRTTPAWLVLGPLDRVHWLGLEGRWPLFRGVFRPEGWQLLARRRGETVLSPSPVVAGKNLGALLDVEELALQRVDETAPKAHSSAGSTASE